MRFLVAVISLFFGLFGNVHVLDNGLARKPPLGWMSWGYYECGDNCEKDPKKCLNEKLIMSVADHLYNDGYLEAGYEYVMIDDCWSELERDENGKLVANKERFPSGMKFLADYVHSKGLKFGMYLNVAAVTCKNYPGSKGYTYVDANTLAEWDVDYVKVDGCFVGEVYLNTVYKHLGQYLNETGRPMVYSCSWPYYIQFIHKNKPDYHQVTSTCNLFRNFHDIFPFWGNVVAVIKHYEKEYDIISKHHGPGQWFDPDMLVVGTGALKAGQNRVQMATYCMFSAPLVMSFDMDKVSVEEKELLLNPYLLYIDQDDAGLMAKPHQVDGITIWVKEHDATKTDGPVMSFAFVNLSSKERKTIFNAYDYGLQGQNYTIMDVFAGKFWKNITYDNKFAVIVPSEDAVVYTIYPLSYY